MLIEGADYFVRLIPFPPDSRIHACVLLNSDTTYTVLIDSNSPLDAQKTAMWHELHHMTADDMHGEKSILSIEKV